MIVPFLQRLVTSRATNLCISVILAVPPLDAVMALHDVGMQRLFVLCTIITAFPGAVVADILSFAMLLPDVLVEEVKVTVSTVASVTHILLGHMILHVKEELLGGKF